MRRVLIFNFFAGVLDRGIPVYAQDLAECMRRVGLDPVELRCPRWLRRAPVAVRNIAFVVFEQLVAPSVRLFGGFAVTIYPYNSAGVLDALLGRSVLVVHDLISNRRKNLAAAYIRLTQTVHRRLRRPVCAASPHTLAYLRRLPAFARCPLALWSNPFYSFEAALPWLSRPVPRKHNGPIRVLLCTGMANHKDYGGALKLFARSRVLADAELRVMGFGDKSELAMRRVRHLSESVARRVRVLPRLTLEEVIAEYVESDLVWVHSEREGFGRCIVEGRLAGRPVVASDISAFRKLADSGVQLYSADGFDATVANALGAGPSSGFNSTVYHAPLEAAVSKVVAVYARAT